MRSLQDQGGLLLSTLTALAGGALLLLLLLSVLQAALPLAPRFAIAALLAYGLTVLFLLRGIRRGYPFARFGPANGVTLLRALLACLFAGLVLQVAGEAGPLPPETAWCFTALALLALLLDGLDGFLARRQGLSSAFGARFDMEVDAATILLLSLLAWLLDKAGGWILLAGALRYLFLAAAQPWPWLAGPLPPSTRRKAVCVLQGLVLALLLAPPLVSSLSDAAAAVALAFLLYSFAVDVIWLARRKAAGQA